MSALKLGHLSMEDHEQASELLMQVQRALSALTRIVKRAPFTDTVLRAEKHVQETLIDPLNKALVDLNGGVNPKYPNGIYPSVYYAIKAKRSPITDQLLKENEMMADVTDDLVEKTAVRQIELAKRVGLEFRQCPDIKPLGRHGSFNDNALPTWHFWHDEPIDKLVWWVVAQEINFTKECSGFFDHAWLFGHTGAKFEPWGFVTEPYMSDQDAIQVAQAVQSCLRGWGLDVHALSAEASSWNPGACPPIVVVQTRDADIVAFYRRALRLAINAINREM